ncbi:NTP transferase domain-containing protein [Novosphingobium bradum]|uniref:NTP transferase domain-containing protein n=1 Tax=Novosphingobium bradum TaxID=1737444 RepID=A0ABV7IRM5_9SPHN
MTEAPLIALLAAGRASRFGADKLAAPCSGQPLASHAARAVLATGLPALCITAPGPRPAWLPEGIPAIANPAATDGLATSVALAAREALARKAPALIIHLADMPCVPAALLLALAAVPGLAACHYPSGRAGVPARFPADRFAELCALTGDRGAGALLADDPAVLLLACPAEDLVDVDTPVALARAEAILAGRRM